MNNKLTYEELKLGEMAKEAFFRGESPFEIENKYPIYLNTQEVFAGLNVTDFAIASVLGGLNALYVGDTGTGKSQLSQDFFNYYFGGNVVSTKEKDPEDPKKEIIKITGNSVKIRGKPELDIYEEVYRDLNMIEGKWVPNINIQAKYHFLDELNRCPPVTQNQFFGLGDGFLEHKGMKLPIGSNGYAVTNATANLGNGEFGGTFDTDKALYSRFAITLDFDYKQFSPTMEDRMVIDFLRAANPKIKEAPIRDISHKIIAAEKIISEKSTDLGLEADAAINYIKFGLENCFNTNIASKEKNWPKQCQDCDNNTDGSAICSQIRSPLPRTINSLRKYAAALDFLINLKNPKIQYDATDLVFKAFEISGAYQRILNPSVLRQKYSDQNPKMIKDVVEILKKDFRENSDLIVTYFESIKDGTVSDYFFDLDDDKNIITKTIGSGYSGLIPTAKSKVIKFESGMDKICTDNRPIGLSWVREQSKLYKKLLELQKDNAKAKK